MAGIITSTNTFGGNFGLNDKITVGGDGINFNNIIIPKSNNFDQTDINNIKMPVIKEIKNNYGPPIITINKNKCCCCNCKCNCKCTFRRFIIYIINFINYLNFFECKGCKTKCKKIEDYFYEEDFINSKLDVTHCLKNIILFDILRDMLKEKKDIFKFLSVPFVISEKDKNFYSEYHEDYNQDDFKSFETETSDLVKNLEEKSKTEKLHDCLIFNYII